MIVISQGDAGIKLKKPHAVARSFEPFRGNFEHLRWIYGIAPVRAQDNLRSLASYTVAQGSPARRRPLVRHLGTNAPARAIAVVPNWRSRHEALGQRAGARAGGRSARRAAVSRASCAAARSRAPCAPSRSRAGSRCPPARASPRRRESLWPRARRSACA